MLQLLLNGFILGLVASPTCPSNAEEIRLGTRYGFFSALFVGVGAVVGDALILIVIWLGVYPLIQNYPLALTTLWFLGSAVLAYVAWGIFREMNVVIEVSSDDEQAAAGPAIFWQAFWIGLSITTFNPFTALWWLGLLGPTFATSQTIPLPFVSAVLIGSLAWFAALAFLLKVARHWLTRRVRRWILGISGAIIIGYAIFFLWKGIAAIF